MPSHFSDIEALNVFIQHKVKDGLLVTYRTCTAYAGMVLAIMIVFDTRKAAYKLDLQWMSLGLDLYGDTLQESYVYQFESLEKLLAYLLEKYAINVTDIPVKFEFDASQFPSPITEAAKKPLFEAAWQQFQVDFEKGAFLDPALKLIYSSLEN